jgi:methionyl-tRNA formyltransferase
VKIVFCGTPRFAVPSLEALITAGHEIPLVVSQPDRPVGRKQEVTAPPVKQIALAAGLLVTQPEKIRNNQEFRSQLYAIQPDAIVVVAYGRIIPPWMLALPRLGCVNLHASLLPKYRGAAPIQWAVAMGETVTGNTTMLLEEGLDTGPILLQQTLDIHPQETAVGLFDKLAIDGAPLLIQTLAGLDDGSIMPRPQDDSNATLASLLTREDGRIDFAARTAQELKNRWRGFQPWPGAFTALEGRKLIVHNLDVAPRIDIGASGIPEPGRILIEHDDRLLVACAGDTWIDLIEVQLEGKKRMTAKEFLHGHLLATGMRLG